MTNTDALQIVEETVYTDGSGSCGLYTVWGVSFSGINNGEGKVTVTPVGIGSRYRSPRERGIIRSGARKVEAHVAALIR